MYISNETVEQTEERLKQVIKRASLHVFDELYYFKETGLNDFQFDPNALAMVKDKEVWSYLVPIERTDSENFKIFSFHFESGADNSGFVGWLASRIKSHLGSGVFVICGQNSNAGGIFDYWGCPESLSTDVVTFINALKN